MKLNLFFTFVTSAAVLILMNSSALAASTQTSNMAVSAQVVTACTINAGALSFGTFTGTQVDATANIIVNCTNGGTYSIDLDAGAGTGATTTTRKLTSGANTLSYTIYTDSGRNTVWKTGSGNNITATGTGNNQTIPAYGRLPAAALTVGNYTDTVVATITYG